MPERGMGPSVPSERRGSDHPECPSQAPTRLEQAIIARDQLPPPEPDRAPPLRVNTDKSPAEPAIPGYEILNELGSGGMGVVYRARHVALDRVVALKMIRSGGLAREYELARFRTEAEAVARLKHPNIVQIYDVDECDGRPFIALEYVEGGSLDQSLNGAPQPVRAAAELVETLARAMHAAHEQKVIHRDLKPANVLLTVDKIPKITDFGLAKRLDHEAGQTLTGTVMGTPSYMAPEQAAGKIKEIGPASDIYSLGAILYELLTGRPPFLAESWEATREQVLTQEPVAPRRLQPRLPRDLQTICLKCLEREASRRYGSAAALAGDLKCWQQGEPILAKPESRIQRAWRSARRHPLTTLALLAICLGSIIGPIAIYLTSPERRIESVEQKLREGQTVTLIGNTGQPIWYQWRTTEGTKKAFEAEDKTFAIQSFEYGLLELLRDAQRDSFLLSAEVRHDQGPREDSEVGIFFSYDDQPASEVLEHRYCCVAFNGSPDVSTYRSFRVEDRSAKEMQVALKVQRHREPEVFSENLPLEMIHLPISSLNWGSSPSWHHLAMEFTPARVRFLGDGACTIELTPERVQTTINALLDKTDARGQRNFHYAPRNGLGLYIYKSTASFRNVSIKPL